MESCHEISGNIKAIKQYIWFSRGREKKKEKGRKAACPRNVSKIANEFRRDNRWVVNAQHEFVSRKPFDRHLKDDNKAQPKYI